jgi:hypothetical protein
VWAWKINSDSRLCDKSGNVIKLSKGDTLHLMFVHCPVKWPDNLTNICMYYWNNRPYEDIRIHVDGSIAEHSLPGTVTHLSFGKYFNNYILELPYNLTHLTFGNAYNRINMSWPKRLTHLTFGDEFNQDITLPMLLVNLVFGRAFNHMIKLWPDTLTHLTIFNSHIQSLPKNLQFLSCDGITTLDLIKLPDVIPPNLNI